MAKDDSDAHYISLYQNIVMSSNLIPHKLAKLYPVEIPYDLNNPVLKNDELKRRMCKNCDLYFGSIKSASVHQKECFDENISDTAQPIQQIVPRVRPTRIAAQRQGELLCALAYQELEWHAFEDVDTTDLEVPDEVVPVAGTPVFHEQEHSLLS